MKKRMKKSKVYFQMFLSYLGILVIPMILAMGLYVYTFHIIRSQAEEMNKNLLVMVKNELDYEIENIWKIASRMALDDRVQMAANVKKNFTSQDQMNLYDIYMECLSINMSEDFIDDIFLVFNNTGKVVSINGNMSDCMFYDIYYKSREFSYEQFQEYMKRFHYGDMLPVKLDSGKEMFLFTMTTLKPDFRDSSATICIAVNAETIRKRFQSMRWSDTMDVVCLTESDYRVSAEEQISGLFEWDYEL